jgi:hypothetical protein
MELLASFPTPRIVTAFCTDGGQAPRNLVGAGRPIKNLLKYCSRRVNATAASFSASANSQDTFGKHEGRNSGCGRSPDLPANDKEKLQ